MKYEALQQAAVEASTELRRIVAEIDQLEAQRLGLLARRESLQVIGQQLLAVMSMFSASAPDDAVPAPETTETEPVVFATALPELRTEALPEPSADPIPPEEVPTISPADSVSEEVAAKWPSLVELLAKSKPSSLRDEGWRAVPPATHLELRALARAAD